MLKDTMLTLNSITNEVPPELFSMFTEVFLNHKLNLTVPPGLFFMVSCSARSFDLRRILCFSNPVPPELFLFAKVFLLHPLNLTVPPGLLFMVWRNVSVSRIHLVFIVFFRVCIISNMRHFRRIKMNISWRNTCIKQFMVYHVFNIVISRTCARIW